MHFQKMINNFHKNFLIKPIIILIFLNSILFIAKLLIIQFAKYK